jgi:hypothetical protein
MVADSLTKTDYDSTVNPIHDIAVRGSLEASFANAPVISPV